MTSLSYDSVREKMKDIGLRTSSWNNLVIATEALERGVHISTTGRGMKVRMRHGKTRHFWRSGRNSLNSPLARRCADYKVVTNNLLRSAGVHAPDNAIFSAGEAPRAWAWAKPIAPVVVKPNNGMQGDGVFVDIHSWDSFSQAFDSVASRKGLVLVERFHPGQDHRVLVVDGEVVAATRRLAAHVVGDGESTIAQLVEAKNAIRPAIHKKIKLDDTAIRYIGRIGLTVSSIPAKDDTIQLRGTANLHTGGDAMDATDLLTSEQIEYVRRAARTIPGLRIAGFDLLIPQEPGGDKPVILEINENPMISMHHFPAIGLPRDAAKAVVDAMFPETSRLVGTISQ